MKKYRLIKEYPGSDEKGTIVSLKTPNGLYEGWQYNYHSKHVENNPEYWEEVVEKDYEIAEVQLQDKTILTFEGQKCIKRSDSERPERTYDLDRCLLDPSITIYSVKRLSDGLVFTVGDTIVTKTILNIETVTGFRIIDGTTSLKNGIWVEVENGEMHLDRIKEIRKPLFTTEDGVPVYSYDTKQHWVINGCYAYALGLSRHNVELIEKKPDIYKVFSTKQAAQDYIRNKVPRLSIQDCSNILQKWLYTGDGLEKVIDNYITENNK